MTSRANKSLSRKQRKRKELKSHIAWLEAIVKAGKDLDVNLLSTKKTTSKLTGEQEVVSRDRKQTKLIIDKLVSRNAR
jgi:hypothetical protein